MKYLGFVLVLGVCLAEATLKRLKKVIASTADGLMSMISFAGSGGPGLASSTSFYRDDKLGFGMTDFSGVVDTPRALIKIDMIKQTTESPMAGTEGGRFGALLRSGAATIRNFLTSTSTIGAFNLAIGRRDHMRDQAAAA